MTEKKRQLIFFWTYLEWGGAQIYSIAIMKVAKPDWDIIVFLPRNSSPEIIRFLEQIDVKIEFLDFHLDHGPARTVSRKLQRQWSRIYAEITSFRILRRYDLREGILHIETAPWQSWIFLTALSLRQANVFVTLHNALPKAAAWREIIWKTRMQFVSRLRGFHIFASNHDAKNKFRSFVSAKFWDTIRVTYTCVNPVEIESVLAAEFDKIEARQKQNISEKSFVVLCVGQFVDRKGRWVFLDAAKQIQKSGQDITFIWLTPKSPIESEIERINSYDLGDNFRLVLSSLVGTNRHEVLSFFRLADAFALPSFIDGLPIALLEAMALGLPAISTKVFAIPEAIYQNETGVLIEAGDADALAREILNLKEDPALRQKLGENGRKYVLANFDEREASRIAISAYKECFDDAG